MCFGNGNQCSTISQHWGWIQTRNEDFWSLYEPKHYHLWTCKEPKAYLKQRRYTDCSSLMTRQLEPVTCTGQMLLRCSLHDLGSDFGVDRILNIT